MSKLTESEWAAVRAAKAKEESAPSSSSAPRPKAKRARPIAKTKALSPKPIARAQAKKPKAVVVEPPGEMYVRLPLAPEIVSALNEHVENGTKLVDMLSRWTAVPAGELLGALRDAATAIDRDVRRVKALRARKRR